MPEHLPASAAVGPIPTDTLHRFDRLAFISRRPASAGLGGEHRSRHSSPSTDFVDYRPYHPGDDFRRIDWNVYGRLGSLQLKLTEGRERLELVLVLDCSDSMSFGQPASAQPAARQPSRWLPKFGRGATDETGPALDKLAFAAQLAGALGYIGLGRADAVRLVLLTPGPSSQSQPLGRPAWRGRSRVNELVRTLASVAPSGQVDLASALRDCLPPHARRPLVIVISDLLTEAGVASGLEALYGTDVVVLHVVHPEELDPPIAGEVELVDAESGAVLEVGASLDTLRAYRTRVQTWLEQQQAACISRGMRYARVRTDQPLASVVLDDLRRAGVLR